MGLERRESIKMEWKPPVTNQSRSRFFSLSTTSSPSLSLLSIYAWLYSSSVSCSVPLALKGASPPSTEALLLQLLVYFFLERERREGSKKRNVCWNRPSVPVLPELLSRSTATWRLLSLSQIQCNSYGQITLPSLLSLSKSAVPSVSVDLVAWRLFDEF